MTGRHNSQDGVLIMDDPLFPDLSVSDLATHVDQELEQFLLDRYKADMKAAESKMLEDLLSGMDWDLALRTYESSTFAAFRRWRKDWGLMVDAAMAKAAQAEHIRLWGNPSSEKLVA
jgi:hypothetical protein